MIQLPAALHEGIERCLRESRPSHLAREGLCLSERYRCGDTHRALRGREAVLAYLARWMPATYAQVVGACGMVAPRLRRPPRSLLDLGSGPGTALWAAAEIWPGLESATAIEREAGLVAAGLELTAAAATKVPRDCDWIEADLLGTPLPSADLVILAHSLAELPRTARPALLDRAWAACRQVLVVVEPGTPGGFAVVHEARTHLLSLQAHQLAPCPHAAACPLSAAASGALPLSTRGKSRSAPWCHFPQRIARPAFQRAIKGAILGWEDAKFSFTALGREPAPGLPHARLIGVPRHGRGRVRLPLCSVDGSEDPIVSRRTKQAFRRAKKLGWGAAIERADELRD